MNSINSAIGFSVRAPLPVTGSYNFRDLGGTPLINGGTVNSGKVFRSDALHNVDDTGRQFLKQLGITRIVDLRRGAELQEMPSAVEREGIEILHTPILSAAATNEQLIRIDNLDLASIYDMMLDTRGSELTRAAMHVATAPKPVLFHCTAGKDRTGVLAALILEAVGADRRAVIADYAATSSNLAGEWADVMLATEDALSLKARGIDFVTIATQSPAALMETLLDRLDRQYGGAEEYLRSHGLARSSLDALRAKLTD
ncbi:tyrosine-protein phosphatase [Dietzia kunjamensis]|uniref:tyrosine-protein phosphatase n=1 Tax=Dietzia kunjamensis TaxID=322509 RepID=UPI00209784F7|nr:tyrosine-protein phosphatase [Dietzia kunjamensis]USX47870.1 tyrosine-protein phosphatase [Dietzia kunjamensis]